MFALKRISKEFFFSLAREIEQLWLMTVISSIHIVNSCDYYALQYNEIPFHMIQTLDTFELAAVEWLKKRYNCNEISLVNRIPSIFCCLYHVASAVEDNTMRNCTIIFSLSTKQVKIMCDVTIRSIPRNRKTQN